MKKIHLLFLLGFILPLISCGEANDTYDGVYQIYDSEDNIVNENWYIQVLDNTWISYEVEEGNKFIQIPNVDKCNSKSKYYKSIHNAIFWYGELEYFQEYLDLKPKINIFYLPYNYNNKYHKELYADISGGCYMEIIFIQGLFYEVFEMKELYYFGYHEVEMTTDGLKIGSCVAQYEDGIITFQDDTGATRQLKRVKKL